MAGYAGDFSRSRNAEAAEERNCFPATRLAKMLGVKVGAVKAILKPSEWHHTSSRYNQTDYYDGDLLLAVATGAAAANDLDREKVTEARETLAKLAAWRPPAKQDRIWVGCRVVWLEWGGTRKRPTATERTATRATIKWSGGKFCTITIGTEKPFRKGISTKGFEAFDRDGKRIYFTKAN